MGVVEPAGRTRIYTIGHSARSENEFLELLSAHGIRYVADVRRFPGSRRHPQFSGDNLERILPAHGMAYLPMGRELGGFRREGYEQYMQSEGFREGLDRIIGTAAKGPTAILCAEALYFRCHRRFLADELARRGFEVIHVVSEDRVLPHQPVQESLPL